MDLDALAFFLLKHVTIFVSWNIEANSTSFILHFLGN